MTDRSLHVLIVEDSRDDAELLGIQLRRAGLRIETQVVGTEHEMRQALQTREWDVILCDHAMPGFDSHRALALVRGMKLDTPFIIVSGMIGEEHAVAAMRAGCQDYILKDNLTRLAPAVEREVREAAIRRARQQIEERLRTTETRYRELVQNANCIILHIDLQGRLTFFNEYAQSFFGRSEAEVLGREIFEVLAPHDASGRPLDGGVLKRLIEDPEAGDMRETVHTRPSGEKAWLEWTSRPVHDRAGRITGVLCIGTDITQRKQAEAHRRQLEAELQHAQKLESLGVMAGGIAHDFNNLLTVIRGNADLLAADAETPPRLLATIRNIQSAVASAAAMTRALQSFSRPVRSEIQPVDVNTVAAETFHLLRRVLPATIHFQCRLYDRPCIIAADPGQMLQVLVNLCVNSRDAMPEGGRLEIETALVEAGQLPAGVADLPAHPRYVRISVIDNGCGMDEYTRAHAFDPFFSTKPRDRGSGLGLAIVYRIVKGYHGAIQLTSAPGQGTRADLYFPQAAPPPTVEKPSTLPAPRRHGRILVVDDEEMIAGLLKTMLEGWGFETTIAYGPEEALAAVRQRSQPFDLAIVDYYLPLMTGDRCLLAMRESLPDLKAIIITGHNVELEDLAAGNLRIIRKPFSADSLAQAVFEVLDRQA